MNQFNLTEKQLDKILNGQLNASGCPKCGSGVDLIMTLPRYGRDGIKIKCQHCDLETELQHIHMPFISEKRFATPITFKSITKALFRVVADWNKITLNYRKGKNDTLKHYAEAR